MSRSKSSSCFSKKRQRELKGPMTAAHFGFVPRRGKWLKEEEALASEIIADFRRGLLPLDEGVTLRFFLCNLLKCEPMRISKKFSGSGQVGKQLFKAVRGKEQLKLQSLRKLKQLELAFLHKLEMQAREKRNLKYTPVTPYFSLDSTENALLGLEKSPCHNELGDSTTITPLKKTTRVVSPRVTIKKQATKKQFLAEANYQHFAPQQRHSFSVDIQEPVPKRQKLTANDLPCVDDSPLSTSPTSVISMVNYDIEANQQWYPQESMDMEVAPMGMNNSVIETVEVRPTFFQQSGNSVRGPSCSFEELCPTYPDEMTFDFLDFPLFQNNHDPMIPPMTMMGKDVNINYQDAHLQGFPVKQNILSSN